MHNQLYRRVSDEYFDPYQYYLRLISHYSVFEISSLTNPRCLWNLHCLLMYICLMTKKYNRNHVHHHFDGHYPLIFRQNHFSVFLILRYWNHMKYDEVLTITDHYFWKRWYVRQITESNNSTIKFQFQIVKSFHLLSVPYRELHSYKWN